MIGNGFTVGKHSDPEQSRRVKAWVYEALHLSADVYVLVTELRCTEPGCPPLETVIAILDIPGDPRQFKIHKPIAEVILADILRISSDNVSRGNP
jgi:hypothetical protein